MDLVDEFCDKLTSADIPTALVEEAVCCVRRHFITEAQVRSVLSDEEVTEAFPTLGVRVAVCHLVGRASQAQVNKDSSRTEMNLK